MKHDLSPSYAIYLTQLGVELQSHDPQAGLKQLICLCSHYKAALRIASQAALLHHKALVISI